MLNRKNERSHWYLLILTLLLVAPLSAHAINLSPNSIGGGQLPSNQPDITFNLSDGNWVRNIALPANPSDGSRVTINSFAGYWSAVDTRRLKPAMDELHLNRGDSYSFKYRAYGNFWEITGGRSVDLYSPNTVGANIPNSSKKLVVYTTGNGNWTDTIVLPSSSTDGHRIAIVSFAGWNSKVDTRHRFSNDVAVVKTGDSFVFRYSSRDGVWINEKSPEHVEPPEQTPDDGQSINLTPNSNGGGQLPSGRGDITFSTGDGNWVNEIILPLEPLDGSRVTINASATYGSMIIDRSKLNGSLGELPLRKGDSFSFTYRSEGNFWQISGGENVDFYSPNTVGNKVPNRPKRLVVYTVADGDWIKNIVLPEESVDGNLIVIYSFAGWNARVNARNRVVGNTALVLNGDIYVFKYSSGHGGWLTENAPERIIKAADLQNGTFSPTSPLTRIEFADGFRVKNLNLPGNAGNGDKVIVTSSAGWSANINNVRGIGSARLDTNSQYELVFVAQDSKWALVSNIPSTVYRSMDIPGGKIPSLTRPNTIIELWDGNWTDKIYLPIGARKGYRVIVKSRAGFTSAVHGIENDNDMSVQITRGQTIAFKVDDNGKWQQETLTIDFLLVYSDKLAQKMGEQAVRAHIMESFSLTNDALENSAANFRLRMVGLMRVKAKSDWTTLGDPLRQLRTLSEVQDMRNKLKADAVYYFGSETGCGLAWRNELPSAFNMIGSQNPGCGAIAMRHEVGHMMGLRHGVSQNTSAYYGYGYSPSRTIMGGNAVPYFATPKLLSPTYGVPMGIDGKIDGVRKMNEHSKAVSGFR